MRISFHVPTDYWKGAGQNSRVKGNNRKLLHITTVSSLMLWNNSECNFRDSNHQCWQKEQNSNTKWKWFIFPYDSSMKLNMQCIYAKYKAVLQEWFPCAHTAHIHFPFHSSWSTTLAAIFRPRAAEEAAPQPGGSESTAQVPGTFGANLYSTQTMYVPFSHAPLSLLFK